MSEVLHFCLQEIARFCTLRSENKMSHAKLLRTLLAFLLALPLGADLFLQSGSTGMVLVVVRDDQVLFRGYGETAPSSHQLPTQDSLLRLCSLTKIFTADVLTKLFTDKTERLDDPLQRFAPPG